jgi:hypothetical protein
MADRASIGGSPGFPGARVNPTWQPVPNSVPVGALTGAPVRTRFYSVQIPPSATAIVQETPENRVAFLTAPLVGFRVYIGDAGVTTRRGLVLTPGLPYEALLVGGQDLWAVTDAPVLLTLNVQVSIIMAAEQQRRQG